MLRRVGQRPGIGDRSEGTWRRSRRSIGWEAVMRALILLGIPGLVIGMGSAAAQTVSQEDAMRAAIHPVGDAKAMQAWLSRVPVTREFPRSEEHTSELQSLMRISYAVFCLKKKKLTT